jgi:hypothetical protein
MALSVARLLCPSNPTWEMLQSKESLREASHRVVAQGRARARARTRPDIVGVVLCRVEAWRRGLAALGERGVWFVAHQCARFAVEAPAPGDHQHLMYFCTYVHIYISLGYPRALAER